MYVYVRYVEVRRWGGVCVLGQYEGGRGINFGDVSEDTDRL